MQVNNMLTVKFMFCPSKTNLRRLKSISCNRNEPKQCINKRHLQGCQTLRDDVQITVEIMSFYHADLRPIKICHSTI